MAYSSIMRMVLGLALWVGGGAWLYSVVASPPSEDPLGQVIDFVQRDDIHYALRFPRLQIVEVGDLVFDDLGKVSETASESDQKPIGEVVALLDENLGSMPDLLKACHGVRVQLYDRRERQLKDGVSVRLVEVPERSGSWALDTLVTPDNLAVLHQMWAETWRLERDRILRELEPHFVDMIRDAQQIAETDTAKFFERHRTQLDRLLRKAENRIDTEALSAHFENVIWPLTRRHYEPIASRIGGKLWDRFPVWGLSWRIAFQSLPMTRDDHFEKRWNNFVATEFVPLLKSNLPSFIDASRELTRTILSDRKVARFLRSFALDLAEDPDLHRLARTYVTELYVDNPVFHSRIRARFNSPEFRRTIKGISDRLEGTIRKMTDTLVGSQEIGITPEFARVLRAQILHKETRKLLIRNGTGQPLIEGATLDTRIELVR